MRSRSLLVTCISIFILVGCGRTAPELDGMDMVTWKADRNGCAKGRVATIDKLKEQKEKLLALSELDIVEVLGKPDRNELSKRNQKIYYYYLEPAADCLQGSDDLKPVRLAIRFNAMGLAKEIRVEEEY